MLNLFRNLLALMFACLVVLLGTLVSGLVSNNLLTVLIDGLSAVAAGALAFALMKAGTTVKLVLIASAPVFYFLLLWAFGKLEGIGEPGFLPVAALTMALLMVAGAGGVLALRAKGWGNEKMM